ncbi:MAG: septum formation protein Maf [Solirubrobacterales bacterium]|nr:septum formation protein Maf [Solirubrobacterales bacterium]
MRVVLASGSPQRREILARLGLEFEVAIPGVEEIVHGEPAAVVVANASLKANSVAVSADLSGTDALVVGCDTDVVVEDHLIGKPEDEVRAREYLAQLSGRIHRVISGLAVVGPGGDQVRSGVEQTRVRFKSLTPGDIDRYLATGEWQGRAGGYAIQGRGSVLVDRVEGDVANVIGLPVGLLYRLAPELEA